MALTLSNSVMLRLFSHKHKYLNHLIRFCVAQGKNLGKPRVTVAKGVLALPELKLYLTGEGLCPTTE